jgi:prepilin-type N-terminal cleavage/methylation domain-containing protein
MYERKTGSGFTLIELVFVIILIALITTIAIPKVSSTLGLSIKSNVLQVSGFLQAAYQQAILTHKKIRISFNMDTGEYWAENPVDAEPIALIDEATNLDEILNTFRKRSEEDPTPDEEEQKKRDAAAFQRIETAVVKSDKIDSSIKFKSIIFPGKDETVNGGIVSFFISGSGINEEVVFYLAHEDDNVYSIIFPPMTGKPTVEKGEYVATKK